MWLLSVLALCAAFGVTRPDDWGTDSSVLKMGVFNISKSNLPIPPEELDNLAYVKAAIVINYDDGQFNSTIIAQYCLTLNAPQAAAHIFASNARYMEVIRDYDQITQEKLLTFYEEMIQAYFFEDEYHVSYVLLHYLHLRNGFGMARKLIKILYPKCEEFARIPEVKKFYLSHKGEDPRALSTLKEFMELIKWLMFEGKFKV
ncbi:hypothetical protein QR680_014449 [Steinernema hermaphroditum]|uniref:Uncharacterized protein n=1 Tax=Steinernema hermaphroditum TaxID=289476 RepID=A0AA39I8W7_9BILA|nr:hypothetical protein QR680_014449 [Steinernema hermaphroditum]